MSCVLDTGASGHFSYDASQFRDYVECKRVLRCAGGNTYPIVGMGTLMLCFRPEGGVVRLRLENVAHVPGLSHHLFSLRRVADAGNTYTGSAEGIQINMKSGKKMFAPSRGQLNSLYASRVSPPERDELAHAMIAPGAPQSPQIVDINDFHSAHAHMHEDLLRKTAK